MSMIFEAHCMDCAKFGKSCKDMTGTEPAGGCYVSEAEVKRMKINLTKKQFLYWYDYYINNMKLADISIKYDVHITTVCKVMQNARKRLNCIYGKAV